MRGKIVTLRNVSGGLVTVLDSVLYPGGEVQVDSKAIATAYGKDSKQRYRKIPTSIFTILKGLGCEEYDMEIRYVAADYDSIALKAFANLQGNDQMYPIGIYAMIVECSGAEENAEELVD